MSLSLSRTIGLAQQFVRNAPLTFTANTDPALSIADWVRQFILAPPFAWRWNRKTVTATCVPGQQDYKISAPNFGWLEHATVNDNSGRPDSTHSLEISLYLSDETTQNLPIKISAQVDDGKGNITFRIFPAPEQAYTLAVSYQMSAPTFQGVNDNWDPIPDYMSYLINQGFLAKTYEYLGDEKFPIAMSLFVRQVVAASEGLSETQLNIFMTDRINTIREMQSQTGGNPVARGGL